MPTIGGSDDPGNLPGVSSLMGDPTTDHKTSDAALVDSFFLPGGLFSDDGNDLKNESSSNNDNNENNSLRMDQHNPTATALGRRSLVPLPNNPWETTGTTPNVIDTAQLTRAATMQTSPTRMGSVSMQQQQQQQQRPENRTTNVNRFNFGGQYGNEKTETILERTASMENSQFQQTSDLIFPNATTQNQPVDTIHHHTVGRIANHRTNDVSQRVLRPPPGFQKSQTTISRPIGAAPDTMNLQEQKQRQIANNKHNDRKSMDFVPATRNTGNTGYEYLFPSGDGDRAGSNNENNLLVGKDNYRNTPGPTPHQSDLYPTSGPPHHAYSFPQNSASSSSSLPPNKNAKTMDKSIPESNAIHSVQSDHKYENHERNKYEAQYSKSPHPSKVTPHGKSEEERGANEALMFPLSDGSKGTSRKSKDFTQGGEYGEEDAEGNVHEEEEEENSIPSSICVSISAESNSSSLSTCSEVDNSELSSHASGHMIHNNTNDEDAMDEGVGYDTDQAHVSEIVGEIGNSLCSSVGIPGDEPSPTPSVNAEGGIPTILSAMSDKKSIHGHDDQRSMNFAAERSVTLLRSVVERFDTFVDYSLSTMQKLVSNVKATKKYQRLSQQMTKISRDLRVLLSWVMDVKEVLAVLLISLLNAGRKHSRGMIEAVTIIFSFLSLLVKFGIIQALEEFSGVASCYVVFYHMPKSWVTLMDYVNLPHWTPHTVTWLAIFALCQQVEPGTLHETSNIPFADLVTKLSMELSIVQVPTSYDDVFAEPVLTKKSAPTRQQHDELSRAQDKQVSFLLLKSIKTTLPVFYMVEGFSSEFGTTIGARGTNRLTMAFMMAILRKSFISSPIAWVSWAVQVLLATFCRSCVAVDILILFIGLSSIRLIRFLDMQRMSAGKGVHERSNKQY